MKSQMHHNVHTILLPLSISICALFINDFLPIVNRAMTALYQEPNWSQQDMNTFISASKKQITKNTLTLFSPEKLHYYHKEAQQKHEDGHFVSFIDVVGLLFEQLAFGKVSRFILIILKI